MERFLAEVRVWIVAFVVGVIGFLFGMWGMRFPLDDCWLLGAVAFTASSLGHLIHTTIFGQ